MSFAHLVILGAAALAVVAVPALGQVEVAEHEFIIKNFRTESGVVLPEARIVYGTYGNLNRAQDNAVVLPSHFMADMRGYEWLIGPGKALNPDELFLIATELFGNGRSSSPSNTPPPFDGPRFPVATIRDNVEAVHQLLKEGLGINHLRAVIGFSMGAQQAFQWGVSYPDFMDRIVVTAGTAKTYGHGIVRLEGQIAALTLDPKFKNGDYSEQPVEGKQATSIVWAAWLNSQDWWRQELWRERFPDMTFNDMVEARRTLFVNRDANDLILQMRTWQGNDIGASLKFNGDVEAALRSIKVPVLYMPSETDLYFPISDARYEASHISNCSLVSIPSLWGHQAGAGAIPKDAKFLNDHIAAFMRNRNERSVQPCR